MIKLPADIYTPSQLTALIEAVRQYQNLLVEKGARQRAGIAAAIGEVEGELYRQIAPLLAGREASPTPAGCAQLAAELERLAKSLPVLHVILPAPAAAGLRRQIAEWMRQNVATNMLVSFTFNRNLAGGAVIRSTNRIFDFSFRTKLLANRDKFPEVLRRDVR